MPLYDYLCRKCGHVQEEVRGSSDREPVACEKCGGASDRQFSAPTVKVEMAERPGGYYEPQLGRWITSSHQLREIAKREGLILNHWPERNPISGDPYSKTGSLRQNPPPKWTRVPGI